MSDSAALEILVAKIQRQLSPGAEVIHNAHLPGRNSKVERQIDVLVRQRIGQYEMLIAIDAKDHSRPVDVKGVEEFKGLLNDVGAHKGALVCPKGFTPAAKERARGWQMDLYSPVDTDPHKWQARISAPVLCDFREAMIALRLSCSAPVPLLLPYDMRGLEVYNSGDRSRLGSPIETALEKWEMGEYPSDPGEHKNLPIYKTKDVLVANGHGQLAPVELTVSLHVRQTLYFGQLPIKRLSGFKDELSGGIITNAITTGIIDPNEIEASWMKLDALDQLQSPVLFRLTGLIGYET